MRFEIHEGKFNHAAIGGDKDTSLVIPADPFIKRFGSRSSRGTYPIPSSASRCRQFQPFLHISSTTRKAGSNSMPTPLASSQHGVPMRFASEVRADRHLLPILFHKLHLPSESHWETRCGTALHPNVTDPVSIWRSYRRPDSTM